MSRSDRMKAAWTRYREMVHRNATPAQLGAVEMAFYAGAYSFHSESMKALAGGSDVSDDEAQSYGELVAEVEKFCSEVGTRCSGPTN